MTSLVNDQSDVCFLAINILLMFMFYYTDSFDLRQRVTKAYYSKCRVLACICFIGWVYYHKCYGKVILIYIYPTSYDFGLQEDCVKEFMRLQPGLV